MNSRNRNGQPARIPSSTRNTPTKPRVSSSMSSDPARPRTSSPTRNASTRPQSSPSARNACVRSRTSPSTRNASMRPGSARPQQRPRRHAGARKPFVILAFALALIAVGVSACNATSALLNGSSQEENSRSANTKQPYVSPYDFSGLSQQNGRFSYSENGVEKSQTGIDVSEMQGAIDWEQVASDGIQSPLCEPATAAPPRAVCSRTAA